MDPLPPIIPSHLRQDLIRRVGGPAGAAQGYARDPLVNLPHAAHPSRILCFGPKIGPTNRSTRVS